MDMFGLEQITLKMYITYGYVWLGTDYSKNVHHIWICLAWDRA